MPVYRLSSIKQTSAFFQLNIQVSEWTEAFRQIFALQTLVRTEREPPTDTTNNNSLLFHLKAESQSQSLQNINCWTQKTVNWRTKKQEITTNQPNRWGQKEDSFLSSVTFSKINELRKCDQKKKHWCFFRVAYFWTTWPTLFNCRFKHSQTLNEAAELSVYRKSLWAFFFFSNKFTTWN